MFRNLKNVGVKTMLISSMCLCSGRLCAIVSSTAYSQSGLISHWDAIHNVLSGGVRSHDSTTSTWYDLTGNGYDLALTEGKSTWEDAALEFLGTGLVGVINKTTAPQDTYAGVKTVEMTYSDLLGNTYGAIFCPWVKKEFQVFSSNQNVQTPVSGLTGFYGNLAVSTGPRILTNTLSCVYNNPGSGPVGILDVYCNADTAKFRSASSSANTTTSVAMGGRTGVAQGNWAKGRMFSLRLYTRELTLPERMLNAFLDDNRYLGGLQSARFAALGFRAANDIVQVKASFACQAGVTASFGGGQQSRAASTWVNAGSAVVVAADDPSCIWLGVPDGAAVSGGSVTVSSAATPLNFYAVKPTHVWAGGSGDDFGTAENWVDASGGAVAAAPSHDSVVYIPAAAAANVTNTVVVSSAIDVKELHVGCGRGEQGRVFLVVSHKLENLVADRLVVHPGAVVTHSATPAANALGAEAYRAAFTAGDIDVLLGGEINVDGKGFAAKKPDTTYYGGVNLGSGGSSHGGHNLRAAMALISGGRKVYDSVYYPTNSGAGSYLLAGGGIVRLSATGRIAVNGNISANSEDKASSGLAGAGGAVLLEAHDVAGGGCISANGGYFSAGSRGSGGRVAVHMASAGDDFDCRITAFSNANEENVSGGPGTIYIRRGGQSLSQGELIVDNYNLGVVTNSIAELTEDDVSFGKVTIRNNGRLYVRAGQTIRVNGDFDVRSGSITNAPGSTIDFSGATSATIRGNVDFCSFVCTNSAASLSFDTPDGGHVGIQPNGQLKIAGDSTRLLPMRPEGSSATWNLAIGPDADVDVTYATIGGCDASHGDLALVAKRSEPLAGYTNTKVVFQGDIDEGEEISWTGAASSDDWNEPENWLDAKGRRRLPVPTDVVTIPASLAYFPAVLSGSVSVGELNVAGELTLSNCVFCVGQAATVAGSLELGDGTHFVCSNDFVFAQGSVLSASEFSFVEFAGPAAQAFNPRGHEFGCVYVLKSAGSIAFSAGLEARCLYIAPPSGPLSATFAAGSLVDVAYFVADGLGPAESSLSLGSSAAGTPWMLKVGRHAFASALAVADCDASEGRTVAANANCAGISSEGSCDNWTFAADSKIWTGAASDVFSAAANWSPAGAPGSGSDLLVFDSATSLKISSATSVNSLAIYSPDKTILATNNAELAVTGDFTVEGHVTASLNNPIAVGGSVLFGNKAVITHAGPVKTPTSAVDISSAGDFTIVAGATIDVHGKGYSAGNGPGAGGGANGPITAHGGSCSSTSFSITHCYGSILSPSLWGSGGFVSQGSNGGGLVTLSVGGTLTLDGVINANGLDNPRSGSGGSVYITCARLSGPGVVTANAGYANDNYSGGGGRIAIVQTAARDFSAFTGHVAAINNYRSVASGAGTVFKKSVGEGGTVVVSNTFFCAVAITEFPMAADGDPATAYKDVSFVVPTNATLSLVADCTIADLDLQSLTSKIELNGHTLRVKSPKHNKGRGWGASYQSLVTEDGGAILWQPGFAITVR